MLLKDTRSSERPSAVLIDEQEDGSRIVRIAGEVTEIQEDGQTVYQYDEVLFVLDAERTETAEDILADKDVWWEFGSQEEEPMPTLEERVAMIEDYLISGGEI